MTRYARTAWFVQVCGGAVLLLGGIALLGWGVFVALQEPRPSSDVPRSFLVVVGLLIMIVGAVGTYAGWRVLRDRHR